MPGLAMPNAAPRADTPVATATTAGGMPGIIATTPAAIVATVRATTAHCGSTAPAAGWMGASRAFVSALAGVVCSIRFSLMASVSLLR